MVFTPEEAQAAQSFLTRFPPAVAQQGKACYQNRQLGAVRVGRDAELVEIPLGDTAPAFHRIQVELTVAEGRWAANCTCRRNDCLHSYAAVLALLASLSRPEKKKKKSNSSAKSAGDAAQAALRQLFGRKLGRSLGQHESNFITQFAKLQKKIGGKTGITYFDLQGVLDFCWHAPDFSPLRGRADLPAPEFLQEFAIFCTIQQIKLPALLEPVLDHEAIESAVARHEREKNIHKWKLTLAELPNSLATPEAAPLDFGLLIDLPHIQIAVQSAPDGPFKKVGIHTLQQIVQRVAEGAQTIHPEALPIFNGFFGGTTYHTSNSFHLDEAPVRCLAASLLRNPAVQSRCFTSNFEPFKRGEHPLQWRLTETPDGDYKLFLSDQNGVPAPKDLVPLPGNPYLYLGRNTVYEGPRKPKQLSVIAQRIPAPALESSEGLSLLSALQLPIPERIETRIRRLALEVIIRCKLRPVAYNNTEQCCLELFAGTTETGMRERYTPDGWRILPSAKENEFLYLFDRSNSAQAPGSIESLGANWDPFENCWRVKVTKNFPEKFLQWYAQVPKEYRFELDPELASLVRDPIKARVTLECQEVGVDWFDLRTTVDIDDTTLTPEEIRLLLNAKGKAVRLEGKGWRRLEYELTDEEDQSLARLGLSPHDFSTEPQRLHALQLADRAAEKMLAAEQYERIRERAKEIKARVTPDLPSTVTATMRPYQTDGFHFLAYLAENNFGGILADDMGLGKTLQTLVWLEWIRARQPSPKASLVVCPKSVMENWRSEAAKFAPGLKVQIWRGTESSEIVKAVTENDLLVLNYAQLRSLSAHAAELNWHAVILDEAQYIKNPDSQTAQAARALRAEHRLALSGTPIENRLLDLWSLMAFAMPGILGNRIDFKRRFDQQNDPFARRRLSARVRPFLLRRTKNQVAAELPDRIEEDLICEMEGVQKDLYRAEFKRAQQLLLKVQTQAELNEFRFNFLTSLLRLRQICCHPALVDEQQKDQESAKLSALIDLLDPLMEEGHKVLVFSQFVEMLRLIRERITLQKWKYFYLDGSSENRGDLVSNFQQHDGAAVFLISLKAGGFGLSLTAASYVVLYDPWWNPAVENQAIDRTHRIGQTQKVMAYRLLTKNSIEQKIRELQRQKSVLAENVLGDESFASSLSIDDLRFLFEGDPV